MGKEKKEIGKLLELLNEYEIEREEKIDLFNDKEKPLWEWYEDCTGDLTFEPIDSKILNGEAFSGDTGHSVIISKSYGFIEWLVREDKIDFEGKLNTIRFESLVDQTLDSYLALLMIVSISNSPIEDLLLYLK